MKQINVNGNQINLNGNDMDSIDPKNLKKDIGKIIRMLISYLLMTVMVTLFCFALVVSGQDNLTDGELSILTSNFFKSGIPNIISAIFGFFLIRGKSGNREVLRGLHI